MLDHHGREVARRHGELGPALPPLRRAKAEFVGEFDFAGWDDAMRRQALNCKRASDADAGVVRVGAVVEVFDVGGLGDRGVDLLLAGGARIPPSRVDTSHIARPFWIGLTWHLPFLVRLAENFV